MVVVRESQVKVVVVVVVVVIMNVVSIVVMVVGRLEGESILGEIHCLRLKLKIYCV